MVRQCRSSHRRCSVKKVRPEACNFKKETLAQVFSFEFCEISKNTISYRRPPVAASDSAMFFEFTLEVFTQPFAAFSLKFRVQIVQ